MKRYRSAIYLALIAASVLLFSGRQVAAKVHLGLPSAVKSTVKKLKVKVEEKQKTTFYSYSAKTLSSGIAHFALPSGVKEIRIIDEASQDPLQDITVVLTINDAGTDGFYFIIDEQGKYLPGIRNISGGSASPQNFQPKAFVIIQEWAAKTWNDFRGKKPAPIDEIDVPNKDLITPLINNGSLEYERSSTLGALALEMGVKTG